MDGAQLHVVVGTGPLGIAVMEELLNRDKHCRMVNRNGECDVKSEVEVVAGDATNPESILAACKGASAIYNCTNAPYTKWKEGLPPILDGLMYAAEATGARLVHADNLYMYGKVDQALTEDLPNKSVESKGQTRAKIATKLMDMHRAGKIKATIGRASNFYGPRVLDSVVGEGVFAAALSGKAAQVLGESNLPHTYTFIEDFAKALVTLGEHPEALGEIWHIPSAKTVTTKEFISEIYRQIGAEPKYSTAPKLGIQFLSLFNPSMRETKNMLYMYEHPFIVDHQKYERVFGAETTDHKEGIRKTISWYREYLKDK